MYEHSLDIVLQKASADVINQFLRKNKPRVEAAIKAAIPDAIRRSPTYALVTEDKRTIGELGILDPKAEMDRVIGAIQAAIKAEIVEAKPGKNPSGSLLVHMLLKNREDLKGVGRYSTDKGDTINWLEWLLVGRHTIANFVYVPPERREGVREFSRTREGIMGKSKARSWNVMPGHENWLTVAIQNNLLPRVDDIIRSVLI